MRKTDLSGPRLRVFISSVVLGFEAFRQAARIAVEGAGAEPVLVNEEFPSLNASSRNTCLDAVDSCDLFILIIGAKGGWRTPSGLLVVQEELERARSRKLPILIFIQDSQRDPDAEQLVKSVSDYINGYFRSVFRDPEELRQAIGRALSTSLHTASLPKMNPAIFDPLLRNPPQLAGQTTLRFVLCPERNEEVIDPLELGTSEFLAKVQAVGHAANVRLLNYRYPKTERLGPQSLVIRQEDPSHRHEGIEEVNLEIRSTGLIVIDSNVTGRGRWDGGFGLMDMYVIAHDDVERALIADFNFCGAVLEELDPYQRHQRFFYNIAVSGIGSRRLEKDPKPRNSFSPGMRSGDEPAVIFETPRVSDRAALRNPGEEIRRAVSMLARHPDIL